MTTIEIVGSPLYQWEVGRQIRVTPSPGVRITAVQFAKLGDNEALSVAPSEPSGVIIATIPNILLQDNRSLVVYITDMSEDRIEAFTDKTFTIIGRPKPSDYVCTETEVISYAYLDERLKDLEGEGLANAVAEYFVENPVQTGATEEQAKQIKQNKTDIETLQKEKLSSGALPEAINAALAQAKASGEFNGQDGITPHIGNNGNWFVGKTDTGKPSRGKDGKDYVLTEADKQEIAEQAAGMVEVPEGNNSGFVVSDDEPEDTNVLWVDPNDEENEDTPKQVQADWSQNDESAPNYVKNRPFWTGDPVETVLLPETTNEWDAAGFGGAVILDAIDAVVGRKYFVTFDGVVYECVAYESRGSLVIGNATIGGVTSSESNGEPFFMISLNGTYCCVSEIGTHTVSISEIADDVHKIDPKYLPDNIYLDSDYDSETESFTLSFLNGAVVDYDTASAIYKQYKNGTKVFIGDYLVIYIGINESDGEVMFSTGVETGPQISVYE